MRFLVLGALCLASIAPCSLATEPSPQIQVSEIPSPAGTGTLGPSLTVAPDHTVWLSWIKRPSSATGSASGAGHAHGAHAEPALPHSLLLASLDPAGLGWHPPTTVVTAPSVAPSSADFPLVAFASPDHAYALWTDGHGGAFLSESGDRGLTWSKPAPWTTRSTEVEKFALVRLADGRVRAAWLDNRDASANKRQRLYTRLVGDPEDAEQLVDASVCDCCQTTLAPFLDGGALLAYRGRSADEIRDILVSRHRGGQWSKPQLLNADGWRINACPVNGPRLATDGSRVAAAWYTAAANDPRVFVSYSPDAGARWLAPLRVDRGQPTGHVDVVLLRDGAVLVSWLESDGSLWLRRITPDFAATEPVMLAPKGRAAVRGVPRLALLEDYAGGTQSARLVVAYTAESDPAGVRTLLVTVPEGALLNAERHCECAPTAAELRGFPIRGTVVSSEGATGRIRVRHEEVPGVFSRGTHDFMLAGGLTAPLADGQEFLGRVEPAGEGWTLGNVRLLGSPAAPRR